jgi:hypothetical protein
VSTSEDWHSPGFVPVSPGALQKSYVRALGLGDYEIHRLSVGINATFPTRQMRATSSRQILWLDDPSG